MNAAQMLHPGHRDDVIRERDDPEAEHPGRGTPTEVGYERLGEQMGLSAETAKRAVLNRRAPKK